MQKPSLGWQSWSPPFPRWHGFPRWDYSPFKDFSHRLPFRETPGKLTNIRYWCSWYAYGWDINDHKIEKTLSVIKKHKLPFTHILIDDGWTNWGDWYTPNLKRFKDLKQTIKTIKSHKLKAGLWFAPFLADKKSELFKKHPEWFINHKGKFIQGLKTYPIWDSVLPQQYLLNLELPAVKKYLTDFVDLAIRKWDVDLLKLDFLYAPYFNPHHQSDRVPHNQVAWLLRYIKTHYPYIQTIACGSPFAPALGIADVIRISKDNALPPFVPEFLNRFVYHSRIKMLSQKIKISRHLSSFNLDPDVRIFSLDTKYSESIWETISSNILGVGDNLERLSDSKLKCLKDWLS